MTDKQLNKDVNKYIREIKSYLICDYKTQNKLVGDIKNRIYEHIEDDLIHNMDDIYKRIGAPQEIVKGFLENADSRKIKKRMNISKTIVIGVIIALLMWGIGVTIAVIDSHFSCDGYIVDEMHDVIETEEIISDSTDERLVL